MTDKERITQIVNDACTRIREHVDSVQIFVTFHAEDGETTSGYNAGRRNFYARQSQVKEWVRFQHEFQRCQAKREDSEDNDD